MNELIEKYQDLIEDFRGALFELERCDRCPMISECGERYICVSDEEFKQAVIKYYE